MERRIETRFVAYHQLVRSNKLYFYDCGMVSPYGLILFGGNSAMETLGKEEKITLDGWIQFYAKRETADMFWAVRRELNALLQRRVENPRTVVGTPGGNLERMFIDAIVALLKHEELNFKP